MSVFRYSLKRILMSFGTYAISLLFLITFLLIIIIIPQANKHQPSQLVALWSVLMKSVTMFFIPIFLGHLISKIISEEIDDGTFLLIISKPVSRSRIWVEKLLAISIIGIFGYLLILFLPLITFVFQTEQVFNILWPNFSEVLVTGLILYLIFIAIFLLVSFFVSSKNLMTFASIFITIIIVINFSISAKTSLDLFYWIPKVQMYIPLIIISTGLIPCSWYLFLNKNFI